MPLVRLERAVAGARFEAVILPLASLENHGVLPLGADLYLAGCVVERLGAELGSGGGAVAAAPPVPYTVAVEHEGAGPGLGSGYEAFIHYLRGLLGRLARLSERVLLLVSHGGAFCPAYVAARAARRETGARVAVFNMWARVAAVLEGLGVPGYPIHADPVEASMLLACGVEEGVRPVSREEALGEARRRAEALRGLPQPWLGEDAADLLYPSSPVPGSAELGEELLREVVRGVIKELEALGARVGRRGRGA